MSITKQYVDNIISGNVMFDGYGMIHGSTLIWSSAHSSWVWASNKETLKTLIQNNIKEALDNNQITYNELEEILKEALANYIIDK